MAAVLPSIRHLTERQYQLFFLFQTLIARHSPEGFARLADADVAEATASVASTLETAARGLIYEHTATGIPAQRLATELTTMLSEMRQAGAKVFDHEAAIVLRAIEEGARGTGGEGVLGTTYLDLIGRLLQVNRAAKGQANPGASAGPSPLILP